MTASNTGNATTAANNATSAAAVTTTAGDLIFGAVENYNVDGTVTAGTGFTMANSAYSTTASSRRRSRLASKRRLAPLPLRSPSLMPMATWRK